MALPSAPGAGKESQLELETVSESTPSRESRQALPLQTRYINFNDGHHTTHTGEHYGCIGYNCLGYYGTQTGCVGYNCPGYYGTQTGHYMHHGGQYGQQIGHHGHHQQVGHYGQQPGHYAHHQVGQYAGHYGHQGGQYGHHTGRHGSPGYYYYIF